MTEDREETLGVSLVYVGALVLLPVWIAWQGFCLMLLWNWFAPLPFARLTFSAGCGLDVLVALVFISPLQRPSNRDDSSTGMAALRVLGKQIFTPGLITLVGCIVHAIVGNT